MADGLLATDEAVLLGGVLLPDGLLRHGGGAGEEVLELRDARLEGAGLVLGQLGQDGGPGVAGAAGVAGDGHGRGADLGGPVLQEGAVHQGQLREVLK